MEDAVQPGRQEEGDKIHDCELGRSPGRCFALGVAVCGLLFLRARAAAPFTLDSPPQSYFKKKDGGDEAASAPAPSKSASKSLSAAAKDTPRNPIKSEIKTKPGQLVCCGSLDWATVGGKDVAKDDQNNLWGFHRVTFPTAISMVFSGPNAKHVVAVDTNGVGWAWGRGTNGQLGLADNKDRALPTKIDKLTSPVRSAACGRHHTVFVAGKDGATKIFSCGHNKAGESQPRLCAGFRATI